MLKRYANSPVLTGTVNNTIITTGEGVYAKQEKHGGSRQKRSNQLAVGTVLLLVWQALHL